jgi:CRP-like cAMP-binding protein
MVIMSRADAERRLNTFKHSHGNALVQLAGHAALPVVLDPDLVHLLRVNYFLDPPTILSYAAEAELLLSPVCTEVDQGLYAIDSDLRDVLLQHLVGQYGSSRLRDLAWLLWEYGQRCIPWFGRPGLLEAQQLTALNFIDSARAQDWLARAEEGSGAGTSTDKRWLVAMRKDLQVRTAAVQRAEDRAASGQRAEEQTGGVVFWQSLNAAEREAFRSFAYPRSFAVGARLIQEGDRTDHVFVILSGSTEIRTEENDVERVVAIRGPGQLVGERAALQISVRSASVVAVDTVHALAARTRDFAAFINDHPRVLDIIERQAHDRYGANALGRGTSGPITTERLAQPWLLAGENCTVTLSDVVGFGADWRNDEDRRMIREALFSMTHTVLADLPDAWWWDDRGDGLLTVISPSIPTARVVQQLHKELPAAIEEHNHVCPDSARIRLRVAASVGPVTSDRMGVSGEAIIVAARLAEARPLKEAMNKTGASLGIIVSTFMYDATIKHGPYGEGYAQVQVDAKEERILAWMKLFNRGAATYLQPEK